MDILFSAGWRKRRRESRSEAPRLASSGVGRLLAALVVIAVIVGLLDHAGGDNGPITSTPASSGGMR